MKKIYVDKKHLHINETKGKDLPTIVLIDDQGEKHWYEEVLISGLCKLSYSHTNLKGSPAHVWIETQDQVIGVIEGQEKVWEECSE